MEPRVLILSASVGGGHLRAAEALELALEGVEPGAHVVNLDVLERTTKASRHLYKQGYLDLVNKAPRLFGYLYDVTDKPQEKQQAKGGKLRTLVERLNMRPFLRLLQDQPWNVVVNTHFLSAEIVALMRRKHRVEVPQVTVSTDFEPHPIWVNEPCEHYFTATADGAALLQNSGVDGGKISITGIPIHPVFSRVPDREECLHSHGLKGDRPVVLQLAGGVGTGPVETIFREILSIETPLEIAVVCGRNEEVKGKLDSIEPPERHRVRVLGFTAEMHELIQAADVMVSKPGGLTVSEALALGAPMVVVDPIPGQETRNSDFLLENGAAIKVNTIGILVHKLAALLSLPGRLEVMKKNAAALGRPGAAFDIVLKALEFCR